LEREVKYMEIRDASIIKKEENYYLELTLKNKKVEMSLTEDQQNDVKNVFNELIIELKKEAFNFKLLNEENDLYSQISKEYIKQLNVELNTVYTELKAYDLLGKESETSVETT